MRIEILIMIIGLINRSRSAFIMEEYCKKHLSSNVDLNIFKTIFDPRLYKIQGARFCLELQKTQQKSRKIKILKQKIENNSKKTTVSAKELKSKITKELIFRVSNLKLHNLKSALEEELKNDVEKNTKLKSNNAVYSYMRFGK